MELRAREIRAGEICGSEVDIFPDCLPQTESAEDAFAQFEMAEVASIQQRVELTAARTSRVMG